MRPKTAASTVPCPAKALWDSSRARRRPARHPASRQTRTRPKNSDEERSAEDVAHGPSLLREGRWEGAQTSVCGGLTRQLRREPRQYHRHDGLDDCLLVEATPINDRQSRGGASPGREAPRALTAG